MTDYNRLAATTWRPGQVSRRNATYIVTDLSGKRHPDYEPRVFQAGEIFDQTPRGCVWRLVPKEDVEAEDDE